MNNYYDIVTSVARALAPTLRALGYTARYRRQRNNPYNATMSTNAPDVLVSELSQITLPPPNRKGYVQRVGEIGGNTGDVQ